MRYPANVIRPLAFKSNAFRMARTFYAQHSDLNFEDDMVDYMDNGFVHITPKLFALAKVINIAPEDSPLVEPAWFIRMAVGDIEELLALLPGYLPKIVFCRNNNKKLKVYSTERLLALSRATKGGTNGRGN